MNKKVNIYRILVLLLVFTHCIALPREISRLPDGTIIYYKPTRVDTKKSGKSTSYTLEQLTSGEIDIEWPPRRETYHMARLNDKMPALISFRVRADVGYKAKEFPRLPGFDQFTGYDSIQQVSIWSDGTILMDDVDDGEEVFRIDDLELTDAFWSQIEEIQSLPEVREFERLYDPHHHSNMIDVCVRRPGKTWAIYSFSHYQFNHIHEDPVSHLEKWESDSVHDNYANETLILYMEVINMIQDAILNKKSVTFEDEYEFIDVRTPEDSLQRRNS